MSTLPEDAKSAKHHFSLKGHNAVNGYGSPTACGIKGGMRTSRPVEVTCAACKRTKVFLSARSVLRKIAGV